MQSPGAKILLEVKRDGRRLLYPARAGEAIRITDPDYVVTVERVFGADAPMPYARNLERLKTPSKELIIEELRKLCSV